MARTDYNNNKNFSSNQKRIVVLVVLCVAIAIIAYIILKFAVPFARSIASDLKTNELIAILSIIVTVAIALYKLGGVILSRTYYIKKSISLNTECVGDYAIVTCTIANKDTRRIVPANVYLILDSGISPSKSGDIVDFPFLLKHEQGQCDCVLAQHCKKGGFKTVPASVLEEKYSKCCRKVVRLDHLCEESRHYIDPGEEFSDDVVFKLDPGVYRVIAIWTSVKDDCICTLKEFVKQ